MGVWCHSCELSKGFRNAIWKQGSLDRSQKPLIGLKILRQKRHGIVTEHASCFFTLEKFNMADGLLLFMHGNCNIISLWTDDRSYVRQFFKLEMMFESNIDFSGFQRSHFGRRTLQKLNILIGSPILDQTASSDGVKDWSRCFIKILSSVNTLSWTRHAEGGDLMVAGQ